MDVKQAELTVVIALVSGAPARLRTCLTALAAQDLQGMEILVPYDQPVAEVLALGSEFPDVEFVLAEGLDTAAARSGASREHHDSIRTVGLRKARGRVVALLEDVGRPARDWARGLLAALDRHPEAVAVGGAMSCDNPRRLNRAVCLADFWRYQPPLPETTTGYASDANIAYRRAALEEVREVWEGDFHETVVNAALLQRGHEIWFAPEALIDQERGRLTWREVIRERYVWGRSFAGTRVRDAPLSKRLVYAAFSPVLPLLLGSRVVRIALGRGSPRSRWLSCLPLVLLLFCVWSLGEAVGYLTARPSAQG